MSALEKPVMILAGGTGGHIFPGLAVARALRERSVPVLWLGAHGGMETRLVPANDFPIETIAVRGLRGKGIGGLLAAPFVLVRSLWQALGAVRHAKPRAVISFGGYAAGPGLPSPRGERPRPSRAVGRSRRRPAGRDRRSCSADAERRPTDGARSAWPAW